MVKAVDVSMSTLFKVERLMMCRALMEERTFTATVELAGNAVRCVLDDSDYYFTAQQCGELAGSLATLVQASYERAGGEPKVGRALKLNYCKIFYQMILSRTLAPQHDQLQGYGYSPDDMHLVASGSFRYPGTRNSYKLFVAFNHELRARYLGIENKVYTFSFDEASWLIDQLCVGGYLLAKIELSEEKSKKNGRVY
ncbi:hypothetical protein [Pseudomonas sp. 18175]|uniref:hypothetical protein n=1 Tax=Pseudomonas sp. 18175 TaxID=3390056 RepID=UPI003D236496